MDRLIIKGGRPLNGTVSVNGAKNAALPIMAGAVLTAGQVRLSNAPRLADVEVMGTVLRSLGVQVGMVDHELFLDAAEVNGDSPPYELVTRMRASFFLLGPMVARLGHARMPLPGGCAIGSRPVDLHLKGLKAMGAEIQLEGGFVTVHAPRLQGAQIHLDFPSVGATENLMMAATLADGITTIDNAAMEPEILDLARFLNTLGARVEGAGTELITIRGVDALHGGSYSVMPDRIEAGTLLAAAAATGGEITLTHAPVEALSPVLSKLSELGCQVAAGESQIHLMAPPRLTACDLRTLPHPGFPTDLQAPFSTLLAIADGTGLITETVFENRFLHVDELIRLGAQVKIEGHCAVVQGVPQLVGAPVRATDLRAAAALVIAGLVAKGETVVTQLYHLDRGYENLDEKLASLGADIRRIQVHTEAFPVT